MPEVRLELPESGLTESAVRAQLADQFPDATVEVSEDGRFLHIGSDQESLVSTAPPTELNEGCPECDSTAFKASTSNLAQDHFTATGDRLEYAETTGTSETVGFIALECAECAEVFIEDGEVVWGDSNE
ncbi:hypothetical protein RYH80_18075 [Halobaculum sp. MBLA0147]|uniref:hypothetical protein n=1 Tax=Halobaculum sp. MBLA0147 TaxID=3079934 RepID=UPI0035261912